MSIKEDIVLHIGAPKCGSSSLQATLSQQPDFQSRTGQRFSYVAAHHRGGLIAGDDITKDARKSVFGYTSSPDASPNQPNPWMEQMPGHLRKIVEDGRTPILSAEGWINRAKQFAEARFLEKENLSAHAVVFVRPPVEWLNSAWWQWGVWSDISLDRFVRGNIDTARWNWLVHAWSQVPGVERVTVRLASSDAVSSFYDILDAEPPALANSNSGIPTSLLYFMTRNREFRENAHTPQVEFIAARQLNWKEPTPWVLREDLVAYALHHLYPANRNLMGRMSPADRTAVDKDPKWWDYEYYKARTLVDPDTYNQPPALQNLAKAMIDRLQSCDCALPAELIAEVEGWSKGVDVTCADKSIADLLRRLCKLDQAQRG
ncbi:hypothetical protein [Fluviibacterium sp. S390]|uniref:hypothetical protein n=1 Tax=Fluviibacterium sp. S390 TaxID=3415139 RepID=UPI003C7B6853